MARILVIDDSTLSRSMTVKALKDMGHDVVEASDGKAGIAAFESETFDCIITDLLMPVLDGHQLLGYIRRRNPGIPLVVLTADIQTTTRAMCEQLGIHGFIQKPVRADVLGACISQALAREGAPA